VGSGPEDILSALADEKHRAGLVRKTREVIKDARHFEAVILYHGSLAVSGQPRTCQIGS
jgi:hypothetical protein